MLRRVAVSLAFLCIMGACVGCDATPIAFVAEPTHDFGVAFEDDVVEHAFLIKNQGDSALEILDVRASCGCVAPKLSGTTVQPGSTIRLSVDFDTSGYGGQHVSKTITVATNDAEHPELLLRLQGTVVNTDPGLVRAEELPAPVLIIDLRAPDAYAMGHLLGAVNLSPEASLDWIPLIPADVPLLLYDQSGESALGVTDGLLRAGFTNVQVLMGGFSEWTRLYGSRLVVTFATVLSPGGS